MALIVKHDCYVPAIDEFGGYSSRLRIPELMDADQQETKTVVKKAARKNAPAATTSSKFIIPIDDDGQHAGVSLCHLLNIDVEKLAQ